MNILFVLLIIFTTSSLNASEWAQSKVVLITSLLDLPSATPTANRELEKDLEHYFKLSFENSGYSVEVHHRASPRKLYEALSDIRTVGLIWVSHARKSQKIATGVQVPQKIIDAFGNDIKDLFKVSQPNLKFLGLLGCETADFVHSLKQQGLFRSTLVSSFNSWTGAKRGMRKVLLDAYFPLSGIERTNESLELIENELGQMWHQVPRLKYADRKISLGEQLPSASLILELEFSPPSEQILLEVTSGPHLLGLVTLSPDQSSKQIVINSNAWQASHNKNIKLKLMATKTQDGAAFPNWLNLKEHSYNGESLYSWKVFADQHGQALGLNSRLFVNQSTPTQIHP